MLQKVSFFRLRLKVECRFEGLTKIMKYAMVRCQDKKARRGTKNRVINMLCYGNIIRKERSLFENLI